MLVLTCNQSDGWNQTDAASRPNLSPIRHKKHKIPKRNQSILQPSAEHAYLICLQNFFARPEKDQWKEQKIKRGKLPLSQTWGHKNSLATSKKIEEKRRRSVGVCLVSASWRFILLLKSLWAETEHPLRGDEQANAQQAETNHSPTPKLEGRKEKGLGSSSKQHIPT